MNDEDYGANCEEVASVIGEHTRGNDNIFSLQHLWLSKMMLMKNLLRGMWMVVLGGLWMTMLVVDNLLVVKKCMWMVVLGRMWMTMLPMDKLLVVKMFIWMNLIS